MRSEREIEKAHDLFSTMISVAENRDILVAEHWRAVLDTLCWVLQHDSPVFEANMEGVARLLKTGGNAVKEGRHGTQ